MSRIRRRTQGTDGRRGRTLTLTDGSRPSTVDRSGDGTGRRAVAVALLSVYLQPSCRRRRPGWARRSLARQIKRHTVQQLLLLVVGATQDRLNDRPTCWPAPRPCRCCCCSFFPSVDVHGDPTSRSLGAPSGTQLNNGSIGLDAEYSGLWKIMAQTAELEITTKPSEEKPSENQMSFHPDCPV